MKKLLLCFVVSLFVLTGCVSTKTYELAVKESEARKVEIEKAQKDLASANQEIEKLKKNMADLLSAKDAGEKELTALNARLDELSSRGVMTSKEIEDLKIEKDRLVAADMAKAGEISALNAKIEAAAKDKEYQAREIERLQIKAGELSSEKEKEVANVKQTYEQLVVEMKKEIEKGDIKITQAVDRLTVNLVEKVLFDSGESDVKPEGLKILKRVGNILKNIKDKQIKVEGHTDNVRIGGKLKETYSSNWELSTARATNVVRYLQDNVHISGKLLSAAGYSAYRPVVSNDTPENRAQNRRIEIVLLPLDVERVLEELKK